MHPKGFTEFTKKLASPLGWRNDSVSSNNSGQFMVGSRPGHAMWFMDTIWLCRKFTGLPTIKLRSDGWCCVMQTRYHAFMCQILGIGVEIETDFATPYMFIFGFAKGKEFFSPDNIWLEVNNSFCDRSINLAGLVSLMNLIQKEKLSCVY